MPNEEAKNNETMSSSFSDLPSARRSSAARRRHTTTLAGSLKLFVDETIASNEADEISTQLQDALGAVPPSLAASFTLKEPPMLENDDYDDNNAKGPMSNFKALRRHTGEAYYTPRSTQRRVSRAGSEIADNMKMCAAMALAELGEISSDEEDDELFQGGTSGVGKESEVPVKGLEHLSMKN